MISICDWFGYELPSAERYKVIKKVGFDSVMLVGWSGKSGRYDYRIDYPLARKAGLYIENVHLPFENMNLLWTDTLDGENFIETLLKNTNDCADLGIPLMVMHASYDEAPPLNEIGMKRFETLIARAEQKNVNIALENMRKTSQLLHTAKLLELFDSPHLGFCFDSGHYNTRISRESECDLLTRFAHRMTAVHLHDNNGFVTGENNDDQHLLPFDGTIDWRETIRIIRENGYSGMTSLEVVNTNYENLTAEEFLRLAFERAKKLEELRK